MVAGIALQVRVYQAAPGGRHEVPGDKAIHRPGINLPDPFDIGLRRREGIEHGRVVELFQRHKMLVGDDDDDPVNIVGVEIGKSEGFAPAYHSFREKVGRKAGRDAFDERSAERADKFPRPLFEGVEVGPDNPRSRVRHEAAGPAGERVETDFHRRGCLDQLTGFIAPEHPRGHDFPSELNRTGFG